MCEGGVLGVVSVDGVRGWIESRAPKSNAETRDGGKATQKQGAINHLMQGWLQIERASMSALLTLTPSAGCGCASPPLPPPADDETPRRTRSYSACVCVLGGGWGGSEVWARWF